MVIQLVEFDFMVSAEVTAKLLRRKSDIRRANATKRLNLKIKKT